MQESKNKTISKMQTVRMLLGKIPKPVSELPFQEKNFNFLKESFPSLRFQDLCVSVNLLLRVCRFETTEMTRTENSALSSTKNRCKWPEVLTIFTFFASSHHIGNIP